MEVLKQRKKNHTFGAVYNYIASDFQEDNFEDALLHVASKFWKPHEY